MFAGNIVGIFQRAVDRFAEFSHKFLQVIVHSVQLVSLFLRMKFAADYSRAIINGTAGLQYRARQQAIPRDLPLADARNPATTLNPVGSDLESDSNNNLTQSFGKEEGRLMSRKRRQRPIHHFIRH